MSEPYYQDDLVTLYHGDCLEVSEWLESDVLVTDPPYGLGDRWQGGTWGSNPMYADARRWDVRPDNDRMLELVGDRPAIVWGGNYFELPASRCWLAWIKNPAMNTMADFELAWTSLDKPAKAFTSTRNADGQRQHPTQKPVALMEWCIRFLPAGAVADPFAGSGSTLVAAANQGRKAIGVEAEERYCELIAKRLSNQTMSLFGGSS
ncbi:methyltransferase [Gordonia phage PhorbesPhlower]|nr:methyltransferase [Gordonia phage PhorbesPhlower]